MTNRPMPTVVAARLQVTAWPDPVIDTVGFAPDHPYSEWLWLPIVGPSGTLASRRLAGTLGHRPEGFEVDVAEFGRALGLGAGVGRNSPVVRTLRRLALFDLAAFSDGASYVVRRRVPPLAARHLQRLDPQLRRVHAALLARHQGVREAAQAS